MYSSVYAKILVHILNLEDREVLYLALEKAFNEELSSKSFTVTSNTPDFIVTYSVVTKQVRAAVSASSDMVNNPPPHLVQYQSGSLIVEITDGKSGKKIWNGFASTRYS